MSDASDRSCKLKDAAQQGLMHDEESGLVYNRARILHPTLGRFMQRDPLGYVDGMSLYRYVGNSPVLLLDPEGSEAKKCGVREFPCPSAGYELTANGCGPGGWKNKLIPQNPFGVLFANTCLFHDWCYGTCGASKEVCDNNFRTDLRIACNDKYGFLWGGPTAPPHHLVQPLIRCYGMADIYYNAVVKLGEGAHTDAQDKACDCCCRAPWQDHLPRPEY